MIKKLIVAAAFAGSMLIGVPVANASPFQCAAERDAAVAKCASENKGAPCYLQAQLNYQECLQALADIKS